MLDGSDRVFLLQDLCLPDELRADLFIVATVDFYLVAFGDTAALHDAFQQGHACRVLTLIQEYLKTSLVSYQTGLIIKSVYFESETWLGALESEVRSSERVHSYLKEEGKLFVVYFPVTLTMQA